MGEAIWNAYRVECGLTLPLLLAGVDLAEHKERFHYGGQAIIEGVMMRGPKDFAVAVRRANGEIVIKKEDVESILGRFKWLNRPFLRGTLALIDSMVLGIKALMYSADIAMKDIDANGKPEESKPEVGGAVGDAADQIEGPAVDAPSQEGGKIGDIAVSALMVVGIALGVGLFMFVPTAVMTHVKSAYPMSRYEAAAFEGLIKIGLFLGYVVAISFMKDIRRVFQYHGAEHKTINAYEAGAQLTVDGVKPYSKVHVRCGTSFIFVVLVTSIIVFVFVPWNNVFERFAYHLLLLPVVAGIAYEVIKLAGRFKDSFIARLLTFPGLLMQGITTKEPEPEMIEVAIRSLESVLEKEAERSQAEARSA